MLSVFSKVWFGYQINLAHPGYFDQLELPQTYRSYPSSLRRPSFLVAFSILVSDPRSGFSSALSFLEDFSSVENH